MPARPKLLLVQPQFFNPKLDRNQGTLPPLGLGYVAAYTPEHWDIEIIDEQVEKPRLAEADLVGITTTTGNITRAYEVAKTYRARGAKVILGGVHSTLLPDEARDFCDSVVCGDAEGVWEDVIADFEAGGLRDRYVAPMLPLEGLRDPRRDLIKGRYLLNSISTSRGCPFRCTFCCIHNFYDHTYRMRPVPEVIDELERLRARILFFTDGNLYGYSAKAREHFITLCREMAKARRQGRVVTDLWMAYASVNMLDDEEALAVAAEAGCKNVLVGFESINPESLKEMKKGVNIKRSGSYRQLIQNAADRGIMVTAEMILGFDNDTEETLTATREFIRDADFDTLRLQLLQPLPGTETYERLEREGRLYLADFPEDWNHFRDNFVMGLGFEVKQLDPYLLKKAVVDMGTEFYSLPSILRKALRSLARFRSARLTLYYIILSLKARKSYANYDVTREAVAAEVARGRERAARHVPPRTPVRVGPKMT